jgi:sarcosine oxidase, subunit gamma
MSDLLSRTEPVPTRPYVAKDVTISLAPPMARFSLRAREASALETELGINLPKKIGTTEGDIACLGPDEWLLRAPAGTRIPTVEGLAIAVTDVSERSVCLTVEGPMAADILMSGCPQDLHRFAIGNARRTLYETVDIILIREAEDKFQVEVWRSFATWLWTALTIAASQ